MKLMRECSWQPPEHVYYQPVVEELCYEAYLNPTKNPCKYGLWNYCNFTLREPYTMKAFDLNRFTAVCNNGTIHHKEITSDNHVHPFKNRNFLLYQKKDPSLNSVQTFSEETCFCLAYGPYIGYFDEKCPLLECVCYPQNNKHTNTKRSIETNSNEPTKKCTGAIRRKCSVRYYDNYTTAGICKQRKNPFKFEDTIVCLNNTLLEQFHKGQLKISVNKIQEYLPSSYHMDSSSITLEKQKCLPSVNSSLKIGKEKCCYLQIAILDIFFFTLLTFICYMLFYISYNAVLSGAEVLRSNNPYTKFKQSKKKQNKSENFKEEVGRTTYTEDKDDDHHNMGLSRIDEYVNLF